MFSHALFFPVVSLSLSVTIDVLPLFFFSQVSPDCALESLDLAMNGIGDEGGVGLAVGLRVNTRLDTLLLTGQPASLRGSDLDHDGLPMGNTGAEAIANALQENAQSK